MKKITLLQPNTCTKCGKPLPQDEYGRTYGFAVNEDVGNAGGAYCETCAGDKAK